MTSSTFYWVIFLAINMLSTWCQVPDPVKPCYSWSTVDSHFSVPLLPLSQGIHNLVSRGAVQMVNFSCLTKTDVSAPSRNHVRGNQNETSLWFDTHFLPGTTYWMNDYFHVGHVHYDIVLMEVLQNIKVERIIMQRAVCHGSLCAGLGSMDSFYKGYFAAIFEAANQPHIPVFLRWSSRDKYVSPLFFSTKTKDKYFTDNITDPTRKAPILLGKYMCFERLLKRTNLKYGFIPTVSASSARRFKEVAYGMVDTAPPLRTHFDPDPPFRILLSYRGPSASRHIANLDEFTATLRRAFGPPIYLLRLLNNSDPSLDYQTQLQAVAESHVVITNHGAFEGNMIYMKNGSLLLEIFGSYGNNEVHTFHRLALMFGVHYARVNPQGLVDHQARSFNMSLNDTLDVVNTVEEYFRVRPFLDHALNRTSTG